MIEHGHAANAPGIEPGRRLQGRYRGRIAGVMVPPAAAVK